MNLPKVRLPKRYNISCAVLLSCSYVVINMLSDKILPFKPCLFTHFAMSASNTFVSSDQLLFLFCAKDAFKATLAIVQGEFFIDS